LRRQLVCQHFIGNARYKAVAQSSLRLLSDVADERLPTAPVAQPVFNRFMDALGPLLQERPCLASRRRRDGSMPPLVLPWRCTRLTGSIMWKPPQHTGMGAQVARLRMANPMTAASICSSFACGAR